MGYLYLVDEEGNEIPGSRRPVDFENDEAGYFKTKAELERQMGEGCSVMDSEIDRLAH